MNEERVGELRDEVGREIERALAIEPTPELKTEVWARIERERASRHWWTLALRHDTAWAARPVVLALAVICTLLVGVFVGKVFQEPEAPRPALSPPSTNQQQLQFETPGGTRIIWIVNPDLKL